MLEVAPITPTPNGELLSLIKKQTGQDINSCYQCGKCTAGCPTAYAMDMPPRQIMRAVQLGLKDEILKSSAIWLCLSCQTCSVRCPREIDIAKVIEFLRIMSVAEGEKPAEKEVAVFYRTFLQQIRAFGRVYETGLGIMYNLRSFHFFNNLARIPQLLTKGKLPVRPPARVGTAEVKSIAARVRALEGNRSQG